MKNVVPKIGHKLPADARPDLLLADGHRPNGARMSILYVMGIGETGVHPTMNILFTREGRQSVAAGRFYLQ